MTVGTNTAAFEPLAISCTDTDCENELHCFLQKQQKEKFRGGPCRDCGKDLVDFARIQNRSVTDIAYTVESLSREYIRHQFWERPFDQRAINHARRKGRTGMRIAAPKRVRQAVGRVRHPKEGKQTPFEGNVLYYAQHAVAVCCRKCVEYWHGIPTGRTLNDDEIAYLTCLVVGYLEQRCFPDLAEGPVKVPQLRRPRRDKARNG